MFAFTMTGWTLVIRMGPDSVQVHVAATAALGEGPCWHAELGALVWVDILAREVHVSAPGRTRTYRTPELVGAAVPRVGGGLLLAHGTGFATLDLADGTVVDVARVPAGPARVRMNDGKTDPAGRFWAGTMALDGARGRGALYRLGATGPPARMIERLSVSNGLGWSPDATRMFLVDTPTRSVAGYAFDVDRGTLGRRTVLVDSSPFSGLPDGLAVDADGNVWVAFWDGAAVRCFSGADGRLLDEIRVPVTRPTSCTFGGPELATLLITTARTGLPDAQLAREPLAGSVLAVEPGVRGMPAHVADCGSGPSSRGRADATSSRV
jgi:sugar lactone lactonase YvrE